MKPEPFITVGKVVGAHGIKGALRVHFYTESADFFALRRTIVIAAPTGGRKTFEIEWAKPHSKGILLSLKGVSDRSAAEDMREALLQVDRSEFPELEEGSYYWYDLIGMDVVDRSGMRIGRLESILQTGSNDVYVVRGKDGEILVPALASVVRKVEVANNRMQVDLPDGL
ncbi:MAG: ribosome maturation factor RimM [Desulfobacterales bacterium]